MCGVYNSGSQSFDQRVSCCTHGAYAAAVVTAVALTAMSALILVTPGLLGINPLAAAAYHGTIAGTALSGTLVLVLGAAWAKSCCRANKNVDTPGQTGQPANIVVDTEGQTEQTGQQANIVIVIEDFDTQGQIEQTEQDPASILATSEANIEKKPGEMGQRAVRVLTPGLEEGFVALAMDELSDWEKLLADNMVDKAPPGALSSNLISELIGKGINHLQNHWLRGGTIQVRLHQHLMRGILDSMYHKVIGRAPAGLDLATLVETVVDSFPKFDQESSSFALIGQEIRKIFEKFAKRSVAANILRYDLFNLMEEVYKTPEYQAYVASEKKLDELAGTGCPSHIVEEIRFFQDVAHSMFMGPKLHQFADESVHAALSSGAAGRSDVEKNPSAKALGTQLSNDAERIEKADKEIKGGKLENTVNKLSGHFNVQFRPLVFNNFMQHLFDIKVGGSLRHFLRFGTPTREIDGKEAAIEPVLFLFLDKMIENGESILSVQLQNLGTSKAAVGGEEKQRVQLMVDLAKDPRYSQAIKVLALPEDSDFYHQVKESKALDNADAFKDELLGQLREGRDGLYILPVKDDEERVSVAADIELLINQIHRIFYQGKETLTAEERHTFQKLLYAHLTLYFLQSTEASHVHVQCKDAMDRAMSLVVLLYYQGLIQMGKDTDPERLREVQILTQEAALFIKGQAMHGERFETFLACINQIETLPDDNRQALARMKMRVKGEQIKVDDLEVQSDPLMSLEVFPAEETAEDKYIENLNQQKGFRVRIPRLAEMPCDNPDVQLERDVTGNFFYMINGRPIGLELDKNNKTEQFLKIAMQHGDDPFVLIKKIESFATADNYKQDMIDRLYEKTTEKLFDATKDKDEVRKDLGQQIVADMTAIIHAKYSQRDLGYSIHSASHKSCGGTVINLVINDKNAPTAVEVYQNYRLQKMDSSRDLFYFQGRMKLDLATRRTKIEVTEPLKEPPLHFKLFNGESTEQYHDNTPSGESA